MSQRFDEIAKRAGGQRPIERPIPLSQIRVVVLRAQHDLERTGTAHEAGEMLGGAAARYQAKRRLRLTEKR